MKLLVIDTSLALCTAGVFWVRANRTEALGLKSEVMAKGHSERLAGQARDAVAQAGTGFQSLERIGVTVGPGSFTGLRVGLAFAQGLGAALGVPVVGLSSLDALAASVPEDRSVAALIDARRGQVYGRLWQNGTADMPPAAWTLDQAVGLLKQASCSDLALVGSGAPLMAETFPRAAIYPLDGPDPHALARMTALARPESCPPRPLYLRAPDAKPPTRLPGQARTPSDR